MSLLPKLPCSPFLDLHLGDCMELMSQYPDKYFDLAIVDPPYGIGMSGGNVGYKGNNNLARKEWDKEPPPPEYFAEMMRVSKNWIVWGANYFSSMWPTRSFVLWNKGAGFQGRTYAEGELAATSFDRNAQVGTYDPLARRSYVGRIHPSQKPVQLYAWLMDQYAEKGQKLLDTHLGSGSIAIASHYAGIFLTACEIDADYFAEACARIKRETRQMDLFE